MPLEVAAPQPSLQVLSGDTRQGHLLIPSPVQLSQEKELIPGAHGNACGEGGASYPVRVCHQHPGHRTGLQGNLTPQTSPANLGPVSGDPVSFAVSTVAVKCMTSLFPKMEICPCLSVWDTWKVGYAGVSFRRLAIRQ